MNDFIDTLRMKYPAMYENTYDLWIGPGWQPIIMALSASIHSYIESYNKHNEYLRTRGGNGVDISSIEDIVPVTVEQIKEKFGGLRFYYSGGDEKIDGMVTMAEQWAEHTCEECGKPGHVRYDLSWHKTLCDIHYAERLVGKGN